MDYAAAVALLPGDYGLALLLDDAGAEPAIITRRLDIDIAAVGPMLDLARIKLTSLLARSGGPEVTAVRGEANDPEGRPGEHGRG